MLAMARAGQFDVLVVRDLYRLSRETAPPRLYHQLPNNTKVHEGRTRP